MEDRQPLSIFNLPLTLISLPWLTELPGLRIRQKYSRGSRVPLIEIVAHRAKPWPTTMQVSTGVDPPHWVRRTQITFSCDSKVFFKLSLHPKKCFPICLSVKKGMLGRLSWVTHRRTWSLTYGIGSAWWSKTSYIFRPSILALLMQLKHLLANQNRKRRAQTFQNRASRTPRSRAVTLPFELHGNSARKEDEPITRPVCDSQRGCWTIERQRSWTITKEQRRAIPGPLVSKFVSLDLFSCAGSFFYFCQRKNPCNHASCYSDIHQVR